MPTTSTSRASEVRTPYAKSESGTSLSIVREIAAPPERVFEALTRPDDIVRWFGPSADIVVDVADVDLVIGGRWRIAMRTPDGESHGISGCFVEIDRPRRLAMTWAWQSKPDAVTLVEYELSAKPVGGRAGTRLVLIHSGFTAEPVRDRHEQGWQGTLSRLAGLLEG